jgi:hypothetical protein
MPPMDRLVTSVPKLIGLKCGTAHNMHVCLTLSDALCYCQRHLAFCLNNVAYSLASLCFTNELINHDEEALHCDFACVLYLCLLKPPCSIWIREIVDSAVQIKECLIHEANSARKTFLSPKNSGLLSNVWCMLFRLEKLNLLGVID